MNKKLIITLLSIFITSKASSGTLDRSFCSDSIYDERKIYASELYSPVKTTHSVSQECHSASMQHLVAYFKKNPDKLTSHEAIEFMEKLSQEFEKCLERNTAVLARPIVISGFDIKKITVPEKILAKILLYLGPLILLLRFPNTVVQGIYTGTFSKDSNNSVILVYYFNNFFFR